MTSERAMPSCNRDSLVCPAIRWAEAEIERLRATLQQCLRQWKMYSEMAENNEGFDLANEKSHEADMYRAAYALAHPPA